MVHWKILPHRGRGTACGGGAVATLAIARLFNAVCPSTASRRSPSPFRGGF
jgi:hypothetical protein